MNLEAALLEIGDYLGLDGAELIRFAEEDDLGGFDFDASKATFPGGSLWSVEGKAIYALVRALRPQQSVELGTWHGCSATHILAALDGNWFGELCSVDVWEGAGSLVPEEYTRRWDMAYMDAVSFIERGGLDKPIDFVFEDCIHSASEVEAIARALKPKLRKGAIVVHHDSEHGDDGVQVKRGVEAAGVHDYLSVLIEPSDCGLLFWVNT